jgi:hypothetical protein
MKASPDTLLKTIAPSRDDIVIAVECVFHVVLARRPVCPRGHPLRARTRPLHESHPRRQSGFAPKIGS